MSDLDILNTIASEPIRPPEHISLEQIINEIPNMDFKNPATYALYMYYNPHLNDDEREKCEAIINKLKIERTKINERNIEYLERHKHFVKEEDEAEEVPSPPHLVRS